MIQQEQLWSSSKLIVNLIHINNSYLLSTIESLSKEKGIDYIFRFNLSVNQSPLFSFILISPYIGVMNSIITHEPSSDETINIKPCV